MPDRRKRGKRGKRPKEDTPARAFSPALGPRETVDKIDRLVGN
jgi:hypothetical protein